MRPTCTTFFNFGLGNKKQDREEILAKNGVSVNTKTCKSIRVADKEQAKKPYQDIDIRHKKPERN